MRRSLLKLIVATGVVLGLSVAASAAPKKPLPPPPLPPAWSWTGFYIGGNVGYSWGNSNTTVNFFDPTGLLGSAQSSFGMPGFVGGGQIGYNWQVTNWVWGVETDIAGSGERGSAVYTCTVAMCSIGPITDSLSQKIEWFGTSRGRVGFLWTPDVLIYATGGAAYGEVKTTEAIAGPGGTGTLGFNTTRLGWTVGTGAEGHIAGSNWTWQVQYLYIDLGHVSGSGGTTVVTSGVGFCDTHVCQLTPAFNSHITDNVLTLGVNYKLP